MPLKKTLVLSIDGLGARDLGFLGNTWIETPAFNRLAARANVFEHCVVCSTRLDQSLASMLAGSGWPDRKGESDSIVAALREQGISALLFSDTSLAFPPSIEATCFDRAIQIAGPRVAASAASWEQTHCASFFAQLIEARHMQASEHLLWAHYGGLTTCWDAPYELRERMVEEDDPSPPTWTTPPQAIWQDRDPDEQLRMYQAMAAEIQVLDLCLGILLDLLFEEPDTRLILASPRGYPLGEHGVVGLDPAVLYSEATAVPLLIADFEAPLGWRWQRLVQPTLVGDVIKRWSAPPGVEDEIDDRWLSTVSPLRATCRSDESQAIRIAEWLWIQKGGQSELYVKPDDRWESNDVSTRCPDIVEELRAIEA